MVDVKKCKQCGYLWTARVEQVKMCPKCKSRIWDKKQDQEKNGDKSK
jgi:predicted Zn-ribbon and HTH transcriptional regulator